MKSTEIYGLQIENGICPFAKWNDVIAFCIENFQTYSQFILLHRIRSIEYSSSIVVVSCL